MTCRPTGSAETNVMMHLWMIFKIKSIIIKYKLETFYIFRSVGFKTSWPFHRKFEILPYFSKQFTFFSNLEKIENRDSCCIAHSFRIFSENRPVTSSKLYSWRHLTENPCFWPTSFPPDHQYILKFLSSGFTCLTQRDMCKVWWRNPSLWSYEK